MITIISSAFSSFLASLCVSISCIARYAPNFNAKIYSKTLLKSSRYNL